MASRSRPFFSPIVPIQKAGEDVQSFLSAGNDFFDVPRDASIVLPILQLLFLHLFFNVGMIQPL
jgi:hypothetical protein